MLLARIATHNPALNAVVTLDAEGARRAARAADAARANGASTGPLHGVPLTVKDAFCTAGLRTTCGYPPLRDYLPLHDAAVVSRLKAAGAILLGKTNVPWLLDDAQTDNPIFGRTNNPWDLQRTPGGSSGGGAAAVAAGLSLADIGSDYGGSVRIPAHFCGVYGLRPTEGRVSLTGHLPPLERQPPAIRHISTPGPLARSVADLGLLLRVIAGPDRRAPSIAPAPVGTHGPMAAPQVRLAYAPTFAGLAPSAATCAAIERLASDLAAAGCQVDAHDPAHDGFDAAAAREAISVISQAEWDAAGWPELDPTASVAESTSLRAYAAALAERDRLITAFQRMFDRYAAFICPVTPTSAFAHRPKGTPIPCDGRLLTYRQATASYTIPLSLLGVPVVTAPVGWDDDGLPIGVQIVGPRWGDAHLLAVAALVEQVTGGFRPPPDRER